MSGEPGAVIDGVCYTGRMGAPFPGVITDEAALAELYRSPSKLVAQKVVGALEEQAKAFIAASPFVLVATSDGEGACDVSPRGGPAGFVKVLDDHRLLLPDLNGNNLIDTIRNVVRNGHVGMLFVLPGRDETLRLNGRAWVTTDPTLLGSWDDELRTPKSAIAVEVSQVFIHCAKSFRRGKVWDPEAWAAFASAPQAIEILACQVDLGMSVEEAAAGLEAGYVRGLAEDLPA